MKIFYNLNLVILSAFLSGCIIQSSQLNSVLELLKEAPLDLSNKSWQVRYADYESTVYAVSTPEGTLFSNNSGDQVFFDGWKIRKVRGMGPSRLHLDIYDETNSRTFKRENRIVARHNCDGWVVRKNLGVVRYSQNCAARKGYENSILLKTNGDISVIRQIVDERYTALMLTKLK